MRVGCGLRVHRIDGNGYLYFWHYEREGGRLWRRHANRLRPDVARWREALRRREDLARARRRYAGGRAPRAAPDPSLPGLRAGLVVVIRRRQNGVFGVRGPRLRRAP